MRFQVLLVQSGLQPDVARMVAAAMDERTRTTLSEEIDRMLRAWEAEEAAEEAAGEAADETAAGPVQGASLGRARNSGRRDRTRDDDHDYVPDNNERGTTTTTTTRAGERDDDDDEDDLRTRKRMRTRKRAHKGGGRYVATSSILGAIDESKQSGKCITLAQLVANPGSRVRGQWPPTREDRLPVLQLTKPWRVRRPLPVSASLRLPPLHHHAR
jgi:hypothetical protein